MTDDLDPDPLRSQSRTAKSAELEAQLQVVQTESAVFKATSEQMKEQLKAQEVELERVRKDAEAEREREKEERSKAAQAASVAQEKAEAEIVKLRQESAEAVKEAAELRGKVATMQIQIDVMLSAFTDPQTR